VSKIRILHIDWTLPEQVRRVKKMPVQFSWDGCKEDFPKRIFGMRQKYSYKICLKDAIDEVPLCLIKHYFMKALWTRPHEIVQDGDISMNELPFPTVFIWVDRILQSTSGILLILMLSSVPCTMWMWTVLQTFRRYVLPPSLGSKWVM
jgi:hypothetical protein